MPEQPSDEQLLRAMRGGDEKAFVALYRRWQAGLYRFALQMSGSRALAEDATQETFLALMRDSGGYREGRGSVGSYLYGIARHIVLRALEREQATPLAGRNEYARLEEAPAPASHDPHEELLRNRRAQRVWAAVLALPVHYREAVILCELHEMEYAEAAKVLECSIGTVRSRLHRGRNLLAERLRSVHVKPAAAIETTPDGCAV